jgi:hypothetical protein
MLVSCTSNNDFENGKQQLDSQGYTEIVNTGHSYFCCDDKDTYSTGLKQDRRGNIVKGLFCSSILGLTIRFE